jgi:hypothetical protein
LPARKVAVRNSMKGREVARYSPLPERENL